ncbi:hypothetical protein D8674_027233 [Pyrus ussuriensis x Pyrus communis]|uniref:Uncharacterized protein n=1 Tax=Pyrus ussuriensis x Pyrus communis TaxID=2448454 RepID=A0A5N5IAH1_9ROSA|nr:hypothetical protein D8674_027233 [Pyrus ussuriensis x Pyrus communis]
MKFLNMLLVGMVVVFLVNVLFYEACRILPVKGKLTKAKKDVLQIRGTTVNYFHLNQIIKQVLQRAPAPPNGTPSPTVP